MTATGASGADAVEPSDLELLRSHVEGDVDAFGLLFRRHRDRLWAVALRTMGNPEDAADGLQDGMIAAYRRAGSFRGDAAVTTWLHRVVVNACLDRIRAARVRRADPLPEDIEEYGDRGSRTTVDRDVVDPADVAVADERRVMVLDALAQLPAEQRAALVLVDMEGYPVAEVAVMLDCAVGTVKSRCARGRQRLAGLLGALAPHRPTAEGNQNGTSAVRTTEASRAPPDTSRCALTRTATTVHDRASEFPSLSSHLPAIGATATRARAQPQPRAGRRHPSAAGAGTPRRADPR